MLLGGLAHDRDHLGVIGDRLHERHRAGRSEPAAERDLLVGVRDWLAEEHDPVVEQRAADLRDHVVVEVGGEVDPARSPRRTRPAKRSTVMCRYSCPAGAAGTGISGISVAVTAQTVLAFARTSVAAG